MGKETQEAGNTALAKKIIRKLLPWSAKHLLPVRYYDKIFTSHFIEGIDFKMLGLWKSIRCFKMGFLPFEYLWFDLEKNDYRDYLPTRNNYKRRSINGAYNYILGNKLLFEIHLKSVISGIENLKVVDNFGFFEGGHFHAFSPELSTGNPDSLLELLPEKDLILKQISGDGGNGLMHLAVKNNDFFLNGNKTGRNDLTEYLNKLDGYLVQERLIQRGISGEIYPGSVNTMRIGTMIDPGTGKAFIAYATHRFGSPMSGIVDNVGQGGVTARIDLETGRMSKAHHYTKTGSMKVFNCHPSTNKLIFNQEIPGWKDIKRRILRMADRMPYLKYVGWDFVLSGDDLYVLEGNVSPGLGLVQLYSPLKQSDQAWNFFRHHGYLD